MVKIYVLQLKHNKYYIGRTNNPDFRLKNHFSGHGSYWTIRYKPLKILQLIDNCDVYDEDKYTLMYMDKYGINNVRGGSFVKIILSKEEIKIINKMINGAKDKCFVCSGDHFVNECQMKQIDQNMLKLRYLLCNNMKQYIDSNDMISLNKLLLCLRNSNNIIFGDLSISTLEILCKKINVNIFDNIVNYGEFLDNLILLFHENCN